MSLSNYVSVNSLSAYVIDFPIPTPSHSPLTPPTPPWGSGSLSVCFAWIRVHFRSRRYCFGRNWCERFQKRKKKKNSSENIYFVPRKVVGSGCLHCRHGLRLDQWVWKYIMKRSAFFCWLYGLASTSTLLHWLNLQWSRWTCQNRLLSLSVFHKVLVLHGPILFML